MMTAMVIDPHQLQHMDAQQLRALAEGLMAKLMDKDQEIHFKQTKIDLLTHEIARYKRLQFAAKSEHLQATISAVCLTRHWMPIWPLWKPSSRP